MPIFNVKRMAAIIMDSPRVSGAIVMTVLVLTACERHVAPKEKEPVEVGVMTIESRPLRVITDLPGRTSAYLDSQIRARVDGIVLKRAFQEGADVKAGQLLFQIDPAPYQANLSSAKAALLKAQANLESAKALMERYRILVKDNAVSRQDYDNAVAAAGQSAADVASGEAAVQTATINLGYTNVTAPISGRIGIAQVTEGAFVQAGSATLLATVQKINPIYVDLSQSSVDGLRLRREVASGQIKLAGPNQSKVSLVLEDGSHYALHGRLKFTDITVDQGTGSVIMRAIFPNPDQVLLPGMFVHAQIDEGVNQDGLLVPQIAVTHDQKGQPTVLVVGNDNKVVLRTLVTGRTEGSDWVVQSGLQVNDRVIVEGMQNVQPGQTVKPVRAIVPEGRSVSAGIVTGPGREHKGASGVQQTVPAY
ncbi:MAG: efflux RND transporter periplasmic adaptor subunit [Gallionella sp.]